MNDNEKWPRTSPRFNTTREAYEHLTPTDDEREALAKLIDEIDSAWLTGEDRSPYPSEMAHELARRGVGFRRTEVPEPSAPMSLADDPMRKPFLKKRAEPSADLAICGCHRDGSELVTCARHTVPQGEPSEAALRLAERAWMAAYRQEPRERLRAALRAAWEVR